MGKNRVEQVRYRQLRNERMLRQSMELPLRTLEVIQSKELLVQEELKKKVFLLHKWSILKARVRINTLYVKYRGKKCLRRSWR